ncbi:MAG: fibronectin type III domain-containing protein [Hyphomicrobiales bacterium]
MTAYIAVRKLWTLSLGFVLCMIACFIVSNAFAAQVTLAWDPNTESDLAGYRVHFGTTSNSYSVHIDVHNVTTYTVTGLTDGQTYYFAATAYDTAGNESGYSNSVSYGIPAANGAPSTPTTPSGLSSALVNTAVSFSTSATDPNGDSLQYRYDWGDGVLSSWGSASQSHTWSAAGQYAVKAQAQDSSGTASSWSAAIVVTITQSTQGSQNAAPSTPTIPSGASAALVNAAISFSTSATDSNGDSLQYRYDWGGGVLSSWGSASQSHSWSAAGQYAVKAQARDSQNAVSGWSGAKTVTISQGTTTLTKDSDGDGVPDSQDAFPNDPKEWADANGNGIGDNADAAAGQGNLAPNAPLLTSPVNNAATSAMATLQTAPFSSPMPGATHAQTRWQVFRDEDNVCLLDIQSYTELTSFTVPKLVLDEGTPFFWRAQFIDSNGAASAWSDYEYFSTQTTGIDLNANGIPDAQEVSSTTDLNKDGVPDLQQTIIKSVKMEGTTAQTGISIQQSPTALAVESVESEDPQQLDLHADNKPKDMPFGVLNVKIAVANPGDQAVVRLYFLDPAPVNGKWYEYDKALNRWIDFSAYTEFASDRMSAALTLRDGGPGDADGVANGIIIDPGGIGLADAGDSGGSQSAGSGGSGGGGGCFIYTIADRHADGAWLSYWGLAGILFLLSIVCLKRPWASSKKGEPQDQHNHALFQSCGGSN